MSLSMIDVFGCGGAFTPELRAEEVMEKGEQLLGPGVADVVEDRLALLPGANEPFLAKLGEVLRQCGWAKPHPVGELACRQLAALRQIAEGQQPKLVGEQFEEARRLADMTNELRCRQPDDHVHPQWVKLICTTNGNANRPKTA